jgi:1-acyl-sn-glycerol-3-phosphate acyltransferase
VTGAWARTEPACLAREVILSGIFRPLIAYYTKRTVSGTEHLSALDGPVVFVANHSSHMDTPLLLRALPWRWRHRTAVAAAADYFYAKAWLAFLVSLAFGTVPVARRGETPEPGGTMLDAVLADGWSLVLFAEGTRSRDGDVGKLRTGAAVLAAQHDVPIVPVHVSGTHESMPVGRSWPRLGPDRTRQPVRVAFGPPILGGGRHRREVMEDVRRFLAAQGAATTPDKRTSAATAARA